MQSLYLSVDDGGISISKNNDERKQKIIKREFINKHINKIKTNKHKQKIIRDKPKTDPMDKSRKDPMDKFRKKISILTIKGNCELKKLYFILFTHNLIIKGNYELTKIILKICKSHYYFYFRYCYLLIINYIRKILLNFNFL